VLHIVLRVIEGYLCQASGATSHARLGAVSCIHRFGSSLNRHGHDHCCIMNGVLAGAEDLSGVCHAVRFRPAPELTPHAIATIREQVRQCLIYRFPRAQRDGTTALSLTPLELSDQRAGLIAPPRRHRDRYHGVLALSSPRRAAAIAPRRDAPEPVPDWDLRGQPEPDVQCDQRLAG
jgi:hypothetical protein